MTADLTPLSAQELVPDSALVDLARQDPLRQMGELSWEHQAILAMYLPDIIGELLAYRAAARAEAASQNQIIDLRPVLSARTRAGGPSSLPTARASITGCVTC